MQLLIKVPSIIITQGINILPRKVRSLDAPKRIILLKQTKTADSKLDHNLI
uniref:Uncharacterized protein n=1 Tax=Solanum lycopersicum TaxID=4081 RepID=A0A3Q7F9S0_SOLLC